MTDKIQHWENVYSKKKFNDVSWYAPHLNESLALIQSLASNKNASIIDVGGGESTLVDDLLNQDYEQLSVLDISSAAITFTQNRLAENSTKVNWYIGDVTQIQLPEKTFDIWHDRAVFHFLTQETDRKAYVEQVKKTVKVGGYVVMATFGPEGPLQCSGLDVVRYTATDLHQQFDKGFELLGSDINTHQTPFNTVQQFLYCWCKVA